MSALRGQLQAAPERWHRMTRRPVTMHSRDGPVWRQRGVGDAGPPLALLATAANAQSQRLQHARAS